MSHIIGWLMCHFTKTTYSTILIITVIHSQTIRATLNKHTEAVRIKFCNLKEKQRKSSLKLFFRRVKSDPSRTYRPASCIPEVSPTSVDLRQDSGRYSLTLEKVLLSLCVFRGELSEEPPVSSLGCQGVARTLRKQSFGNLHFRERF
jgi:hypothetical protein